MKINNLHGQIQKNQVLITRSDDTDSQELEAAIRAISLQPVHLPLIETVPLVKPEEIQQIKNSILNLDLYQHIIAISPTAVKYAFEWIEDYWPQLPIKQTWWTVGSSTAKALKAHHILAKSPETSMTSESLIDIMLPNIIFGDKVLYLCGKGGRELMEKTLKAKGAIISRCELYQRVLPNFSRSKFQALSFQIIRAVLIKNAGALEHWFKLIDNSGFNQETKNTLIDIPLILPSKRVSLQATKLGFTKPVSAVNATDIAMIEALKQLD